MSEIFGWSVRLRAMQISCLIRGKRALNARADPAAKNGYKTGCNGTPVFSNISMLSIVVTAIAVNASLVKKA